MNTTTDIAGLARLAAAGRAFVAMTTVAKASIAKGCTAIAAAAILVVGAPAARAAETTDWKAGTARANITPPEYMWMSGYASRDRPADGKLTDLWAKTLLLEDPQGSRALIVTLDLVGIDRGMSNQIRDALEAQLGLDRSRVALCCSHTHTGPVVGRNLRAMYNFDERQERQVRDYTAWVESQVLAAAREALSAVEPCRLTWAVGRATFAVNRRNNPEPQVSDLRAAGQLRGPVDHDVPVLAVRDPSGALRSIVMGYACHATVLSSFQWSGDYPGFAQVALEERYPGVRALFFAGCGADQNPLPRREVEHAQEYGRQLAAAVEAALAGVQHEVTGSLATAYREIDLPFDKLPERSELELQATSDNRYVASRARRLLEQLDAGEPLSPTYPYPVVAWRLGDELTWIALGGEVVVDYALRLKRELGASQTWVAGYVNDVMAYIPSRRVLEEGGYEGGGAMVYYGLPTVWAPQVEERIVATVQELVASLGESSATASE